MVDTPPAANRALTSVILRISITLADNFWMVGCGIAFGPSSAVQFETLMSPAPCWASGGHSGLSGERSPVVIPRMRILPLDTCGAAVELAMMARGMSPATNAWTAGAPTLYGTWVKFCAGVERYRFKHQVIDAAVSRRAHIEHIRPRLRGRDDVGYRLVRRLAIGCEHQRCVAHGGDRRKIAVDVVGYVLEQRRIDGDVAGGRHD